MEGGINEIRLLPPDSRINAIIKQAPAGQTPYTTHYSQSEDLFVRLADAYAVPPFPIHHDVRVMEPLPQYVAALTTLLTRLVAAAPDLFAGLTYAFDPGDVFRPAFYQIYRVGEMHYAYLVRIDLKYRTHDAELVTRGTNDYTPEYRTNKLFIEASLVPIDEVRSTDGKATSLRIHQTISSTWIGETGRGYLIQGIWMDQELTKFFSKLFLPPGVRFYPYYPFICKYRTICHSVVRLSPDGRRSHVPQLHRVVQFLEPAMRQIEASLRNAEFSESLEAFQTLRRKVPEAWRETWKSLSVTPYLNEHDMKEFRVEL